jgi:hypothetical protein
MSQMNAKPFQKGLTQTGKLGAAKAQISAAKGKIAAGNAKMDKAIDAASKGGDRDAQGYNHGMGKGMVEKGGKDLAAAKADKAAVKGAVPKGPTMGARTGTGSAGANPMIAQPAPKPALGPQPAPRRLVAPQAAPKPLGPQPAPQRLVVPKGAPAPSGSLSGAGKQGAPAPAPIAAKAVGGAKPVTAFKGAGPSNPMGRMGGKPGVNIGNSKR